jgi:hypothetical protein
VRDRALVASSRPPSRGARRVATLLTALGLVSACQGAADAPATPTPRITPLTPTAGPTEVVSSLPTASSPLPTVPRSPGGGLTVQQSPQPAGGSAPLATIGIPQIEAPTRAVPTLFTLPPPGTAPQGDQSVGSAGAGIPARPTSTAAPAIGPEAPGQPGGQSGPIPTPKPAPPVVQPTSAPLPRPTPGPPSSGSSSGGPPSGGDPSSGAIPAKP